MATLYTIGHSNRTWEEFILLLKLYKISTLVDIRTIPKSRFRPWFNQTVMSQTLQKNKIKYLHFPGLGGLRHPNKNSINTAWKNSGFRGFADYMQTNEFSKSLDELNKLLKSHARIAIMCAEAVPWRCHRSLVADAEVIRKIKVLHIINKTTVNEHEVTSFAVLNIQKLQIIYPNQNLELNI